MQWIAPSEKDTSTGSLENRLWAAADQLRANSGLTPAQYSQPVLGLIFLRFAEVKFLARRAVLEAQAAGSRRGSRVEDATAYQAEGVLYLAPTARFDHLLRLPEGTDVGNAVNEAMRDIEKANSQLAGVLPKTYQLFASTLLKDLLKKVSEIPATTEGDAFGVQTRLQPIAECRRRLNRREISRDQQGTAYTCVEVRTALTQLAMSRHSIEVHATERVVDKRGVLLPKLPTVHWACLQGEFAGLAALHTRSPPGSSIEASLTV